MLGQGIKLHAILGPSAREILIVGTSVEADMLPKTDEPVEFSAVVSDEFVDTPVVIIVEETPVAPSREDDDAADDGTGLASVGDWGKEIEEDSRDATAEFPGDGTDVEETGDELRGGPPVEVDSGSFVEVDDCKFVEEDDCPSAEVDD